MKQLIALTKYLKERAIVPPEQLNSWAENMTTQLLFKETINGLECTRAKYTAFFEIERYQGDAQRLAALVITWLQENAQPDHDHNDRPAAEWNIIYLGDELFDIELSIDFTESIYLTPDQAGEISYLGKRWSLGENPAHYATSGTVHSTDKGIG